MNFNNLDFVIDQRIALITVNRPKALNALNREILLELEQAFSRVAEDEAIGIAILTGSGSKAFVAGADIAAMQALSPLEARAFASLGHRLMQQIESCPKPVIAAVNGFALGGGCELALGCDIRIAAEGARFGQPEINLGIIPGFGGTQRLGRLIGKGRALELILTGEMIDAAEAHRIGLVNKVVAADQLLDTATAMAEKICSKGSYALQLAKQAVSNGLELDLDRANRYEQELFGLCFATADQQEGMQAFLDKRQPRFQGC